jgi:hypothetical protein
VVLILFEGSTPLQLTGGLPDPDELSTPGAQGSVLSLPNASPDLSVPMILKFFHSFPLPDSFTTPQMKHSIGLFDQAIFLAKPVSSSFGDVLSTFMNFPIDP